MTCIRFKLKRDDLNLVTIRSEPPVNIASRNSVLFHSNYLAEYSFIFLSFAAFVINKFDYIDWKVLRNETSKNAFAILLLYY